MGSFRVILNQLSNGRKSLSLVLRVKPRLVSQGDSMRYPRFALAGVLLIGGCYYFPALPGATGSIASLIINNNQKQIAVINVAPVIADGGYQTQAVVANYTRASVDHINFKLYKLDALQAETLVSGADKDVLIANIDGGVSFDKLANNTRYRLKAFAYKATGSASVDLISKPATADIEVTNDTQPNPLSLQINLIDIPFSAQASTSGMVFTDGGFTFPASESLED